jgi:hypothetical protein
MSVFSLRPPSVSGCTRNCPGGACGTIFGSRVVRLPWPTAGRGRGGDERSGGHTDSLRACTSAGICAVGRRILCRVGRSRLTGLGFGMRHFHVVATVMRSMLRICRDIGDGLSAAAVVPGLGRDLWRVRGIRWSRVGHCIAPEFCWRSLLCLDVAQVVSGAPDAIFNSDQAVGPPAGARSYSGATRAMTYQ